MPYVRRPGEIVTTLQMSAHLPAMIYKARQITGHPSNAAFIRDCIIKAVCKELDVDPEYLRIGAPADRTAEVLEVPE